MEFCSSFLVKKEGNRFPDIENPSVLGFSGIHDGSDCHIEYKIMNTFENLTMAEDQKSFLR